MARWETTMVVAQTADLALGLLEPVQRAVVWGALVGYCLKAVVELCEGRGPR